MKEFGLEDEIAKAPREADVQKEHFEVFPENWDTVEVFRALQWDEIALFDRTIKTRLIREPIKDFMHLMRVPRAKWPDIFQGVRIMEAEALRIQRERLNAEGVQ